MYINVLECLKPRNLTVLLQLKMHIEIHTLIWCAKKKNFFEIAIKSKNYIYNRQQAPELLDVCTICYISSISFVSKFDNLFQGKVGAIKIPQNRSIDIDNNDDYQLAKYLYEKKIRI